MVQILSDVPKIKAIAVFLIYAIATVLPGAALSFVYTSEMACGRPLEVNMPEMSWAFRGLGVVRFCSGMARLVSLKPFGFNRFDKNMGKTKKPQKRGANL